MGDATTTPIEKIEFRFTAQSFFWEIKETFDEIEKIATGFADSGIIPASGDVLRKRIYYIAVPEMSGDIPPEYGTPRFDFPLFGKELTAFCMCVASWPKNWRKGAYSYIYHLFDRVLDYDTPARVVQNIKYAGGTDYHRYFTDSELSTFARILTETARAIRAILYVPLNVGISKEGFGLASDFSPYIEAMGGDYGSDPGNRRPANDSEILAVFLGDKPPADKRLVWIGNNVEAVEFSRRVLSSTGRADLKKFKEYFIYMPGGHYCKPLYSQSRSKTVSNAFTQIVDDWKKKISKNTR